MAPIDDREPNLYELRGADGTQVSYTSADLQGRPQLSTAGPHGEHSFGGDDIASARTQLGSEVTVTLRSGPDQSTVTLTVLIPPFRLDEERSAAFETLAVVTTRLSGLAGPPPGQGYRYEALPLEGEARSVES